MMLSTQMIAFQLVAATTMVAMPVSSVRGATTSFAHTFVSTAAPHAADAKRAERGAAERKPSADAPRVRVELDTQALAAFAAATRTRLEHGMPEVVAGTGLRLAGADDPEPDGVVRVAVAFGDSKIDYVYTITAIGRGGEQVTSTSGTCIRCVREDVVQNILWDLLGPLDRLREALRRPPTAASATPGSGGPGETADARPASGPAGTVSPAADGPAAERPAAERGPHDRDHGRALRGPGIAGAVLVGVGVPALGVGIGLAVRPTRYGVGTGDDPQRQAARDTRPTGIGLAVAGAVVLGTGIVLLVLDRRSRTRAHAFHVAPTIGRSLGLAVTGRF